MTTLINRKELVEKIKSKTRKDGDILCPDEFNALNHSILLLNRIGTESVNGEVYKSCTPYNKISHECEENNKILLSTKKMPLNNFQKEYFDLRDNVYTLSNLTDVNVFVELKCMQLCNSVVLNKTPICPNLPLYYNYYFCDNCDYKNPEILKRNNQLYVEIEKLDEELGKKNKPRVYKKLLDNAIDKLKQKGKYGFKNVFDAVDELEEYKGKDDIDVYKIAKIKDVINDMLTESCVLTINEYANEGDLKTWLLRTERSVLEWMNMYFQVYAGLYTLQKYFDLTHHDLHWGNILVHKIEKTEEFLNYKIDENYYKVPNTGYLFTIWDFGYAKIPNKLQAKKDLFYEKYSRNTINRYADDYFRIANAVYWNVETYEGDGKKHRNGNTTPESMYTFFKIVKQLYKEGIPLKYIFKKLFASFLISKKDGLEDIKKSMYYKIDNKDDLILPQELSWFRSHYSEYQKAYSYDGDTSMSYSNVSNSEEYMDLFRTRGEFSIEMFMDKLQDIKL